MPGAAAAPTWSYVAFMYHVRGKHVAGGVDRVATSLVVNYAIQIELPRREPNVNTLAHSYVTFEKTELLPFQYFMISVGGHTLRALVDFGLNFTLFGKKGIRVVRQLELPLIRGRGVKIRTAGGNIEPISEEVEILLQLQNEQRKILVGLLPSLPVSCILGMDVLAKFRIYLDFATTEWYFARNPESRYRFVPTETSLVCGGIAILTGEQEQELQNVLRTIPEPSENPGKIELTKHRVEVDSHAPIRQRCYAVSPKIQEAIHAEVDKMLAAGIIKPSYSEWSNPIVMIKKPNGKYRFCLDFRKVNNVSKKNTYPIPNMCGILDKLRSARYISTLDLSQAYFQIPLARKSREITAFSVSGKGLSHFTKMEAPATFQRLLDKLIGPEMEPFAFAYLDDIVIATPTFKEHLVWLRRVLKKILGAGLTINPEKCRFCRSQMRYLGFISRRDGLAVDPEKTKLILDYPAPKNIKQLRRFLGMSSWYRRFIPQFAILSEPLTRLSRKVRRWEWEVEQGRAFERIREQLVIAPTLA